VVDCGLARVPRYEPDVGLTRLETVRVSRASADQRRGRAGRTEPGFCFRLWDEPETASLEPFARPEILAADLSSFALDLAQWGVADPAKLSFLDPPPHGAFSEAKTLLRELHALDADGRITEEGQNLRALPLQPRLARMIVDAGREGAGGIAAEIAAILSERGLGGNDVDLTHRLDQFRRERSGRAEDARRMAKGWAEQAGGKKAGGDMSVGVILALAYPDRVARNRGGGNGNFLLANGRGAQIDPASALAREAFIVVAELTGTAAQSRILLAAPISIAEIEQRFAEEIESRDEVVFDPGSASLRARKAKKLGAIALAEQVVAVKPDENTARILADGVIKLGLDRLPWTKALSQWREREMFLRKSEGDDWPDLSDAVLAERADEWLTPLCADKTTLSAIGADDLWSAITNLLPWNLRRRLDEEAPTHFEAPTGTQAAIDYGAEAGPAISIRVQELFGLSQHPSIAGGRVPLVIELLSPAHRPVQVTRDLPGFWRGSWQAVKSEMKGRYPRHPWPDDPASAMPTRRAKPRGT
jgi:ATP-dependent helicase HrpB